MQFTFGHMHTKQAFKRTHTNDQRPTTDQWAEIWEYDNHNNEKKGDEEWVKGREKYSKLDEFLHEGEVEIESDSGEME